MRKYTFLAATFKEDGNIELVMDTNIDVRLLMVVTSRLLIELDRRGVTPEQLDERIKRQLAGDLEFKDCPPPIVITGGSG